MIDDIQSKRAAVVAALSDYGRAVDESGLRGGDEIDFYVNPRTRAAGGAVTAAFSAFYAAESAAHWRDYYGLDGEAGVEYR